MPSIYERNRLRRSLVQLASLLVLTLLSCGLISLFSLWSIQRVHEQAQQHQDLLLKAVDDARSAQVAFKIEVQSWKNLLLRGEVAADYRTALSEFEAAEAATQQHLRAASAWATSTGHRTLEESVSRLSEQHAQIGQRYRKALPSFQGISIARTAADAAVRGMDRPFNEALDSLVADMLQADVQDRKESEQIGRRRFALLSKLIWLSLGASLGIVSLLLWRILRDPALHQ